MTSQPPPPPPGGQPPERGPRFHDQPPAPPPAYGQQPPPGYGQPAGYGAASTGVRASTLVRAAVPSPAHGRNGRFRLRCEEAEPGGPRHRRRHAPLPGPQLVTWFDLGLGDFLGLEVDDTISGWSGSGAVRTAFFLFLLAAVWSALPAFYDITVGFPRSWITVGLAALGFLLTLLGWTSDYDFSIWALLGSLTAAAILLFAVLSLLPELRTRPAPPGEPAGAAPWADQPAPQDGLPGQAGPSHPRYLPQQFAPPSAPPGHGPPPAPGGATSAGQVPDGPRRS
jgi:hypothetical protein